MLLPSNSRVMDDLNIPGLRDEAVINYSAWHEANVGDDNLKAQCRKTCNVALANDLDLKLTHEGQDPSFFIDKGVIIGIARQFRKRPSSSRCR